MVFFFFFVHGSFLNIYNALSQLRDYGFKDQITRSGLSIPSNIAEGMERNSKKETLNFISYAKGSCAELRTQIYVGMKIGYVKRETGTIWILETKEISAMLIGLEKSIKS